MLHHLIIICASHLNNEFPAENNEHDKRTRTQYEENSSSFYIMTPANVQAKISLGTDSTSGIATEFGECLMGNEFWLSENFFLTF